MKGKFDGKEFFPDHQIYGDVCFDNLSSLNSPHERTLVYAENQAYLEDAINNSKITAIILNDKLYTNCKISKGVISRRYLEVLHYSFYILFIIFIFCNQKIQNLFCINQIFFFYFLLNKHL